MASFRITVEIECDTLEQAEQVGAERLGYDEDYGFDYQFGITDVSEIEDNSGCSCGFANLGAPGHETHTD